MKPETENVIVDKSYLFALRIIKLHKYVTSQHKEYVLSDQVYRSGTSIGANVNEAQSAVTKKDFVNKMGIAAKETRETKYWLRLLRDSGYLDSAAFDSVCADCDELLKLLNSIILTAQKNLLKKAFSILHLAFSILWR